MLLLQQKKIVLLLKHGTLFTATHPFEVPAHYIFIISVTKQQIQLHCRERVSRVYTILLQALKHLNDEFYC